MKLNIFFLFIAMSLFISCSSDEEIFIPPCEDCNFTCLDGSDEDVLTDDCTDNWTCDYKINSQSKISIDEPSGIASGDKNVFQIVSETQGDLQIADDEFTRIFIFELGEDQASFSVENEGLEDLKAHFRLVCFCGEIEFKPVSIGCLQGERQDDGTWFVQGNMKVQYNFGEEEVKFDVSIN